MYRVTGMLGVLFMMAPFLFDYNTNRTALVVSVVTGLFVLVFSYVEAVRSDKEQWEYLMAELAGLFAIAAPFALGFTDHFVAMWTSITFGTLIAFFAGARAVWQIEK